MRHAIFACWFVAACGNVATPSELDAGGDPDGGSAADAAPPPDAAVAPDAAPAPWIGDVLDCGTPAAAGGLAPGSELQRDPDVAREHLLDDLIDALRDLPGVGQKSVSVSSLSASATATETGAEGTSSDGPSGE